MNTFGKIILFAAVIFVAYELFTNNLQVLGTGLFLFIPLLLCGAMMLFMHHGGHENHEDKSIKPVNHH
ncbi:MAG: DUF2933 domain-containing protein [bacterium]|nr:DUF2933 domain-containing protein [bacterium]